MSALCQSLTTLLADFVSLACDWKYHSIDYFTHWVTNMRIFLMYILIIITLGSSRYAQAYLPSKRSHARYSVEGLVHHLTAFATSLPVAAQKCLKNSVIENQHSLT